MRDSAARQQGTQLVDHTQVTSTSTSSVLSKPISLPISQRIIPNRLIKAALTEQLAHPHMGLPNEQHLTLYEQWARGGSGMILTGNVMIDRNCKEGPRNIVLTRDDESNLRPFEQWAESITMTTDDTGSRPLAIMQLNHAGRQSPLACTGLLGPAPVAPTGGSRARLRLPGVMGNLLGRVAMRTPRELQVEEIPDVIRKFVASARLAERAGWDGVEIHAAHGYLLSQFLSANGNLRTDAYGGDRPRRRRLLLEVIDAVRQATSPQFVVGVKINSKDSDRDGKEREDECLELFQTLCDLQQLDFIEISGGSFEDAIHVRQTTTDDGGGEGFYRSFAQRLHKEVKRTPTMPRIILTGGYRTKTGMEITLQRGLADLIGLGRPLCLDPHLPHHLLSSQQEAAPSLPQFSFFTAQALLAPAMNSLWYQRQLECLSHGLPANYHLSLVWTLTVTFVRTYLWDWQTSIWWWSPCVFERTKVD